MSARHALTTIAITLAGTFAVPALAVATLYLVYAH